MPRHFHTLDSDRGITLEINPIVEQIKDLQARTDVLRGYL